jgi:LmbE family N-acetylglucosaminyl deacetylase
MFIHTPHPGRSGHRIILIGAHPDDCEIKAGGTAAIWSSVGYAVKLLSVTNGEAGHHQQNGKTLAVRREKEAAEAAHRLGVTSEVLELPDGRLTPSLENRLEILKKIRDWRATIVISHRPNDYHPDHRYTAQLVQDAAYMVSVPHLAPESPAMRNQPVFLYFQDGFQRPCPFRPDIAVDISSVIDKKMDALDAHASQMYEWLPWIGQFEEEVPADQDKKREWLKQRRSLPISPEIRESLVRWYGVESALNARHAEAFEIGEYGRQPGTDEIRDMFPMLHPDV